MNHNLKKNRPKYVQYFLIPVVCLSTLACSDGSGVSSDAPSGPRAIKDLSLEMHVSSNQDEVINIEVMLRTGTLENGQNVYLSNDDALMISTLGGDYQNNFDAGNFDSLGSIFEDVKLLEKGVGKNSTFFEPNATWYFSQFSEPHVNDEFTLILERPDKINSKKSSVKLPEKFAFSYPATGETFSRQGQIDVAWDNTQVNASISVHAALVCITGESGTWKSGEIFPDDGLITIPADTFSNFPGVCSLVIRIMRTSIGTIDPAFSFGGIVLGHQIRSVVLNTVP